MTAAQVLLATKDLSREEWLRARMAGIGGSDVSAIAGLNKYKSPMGVYLDKIGESPIEDITSEAAYFGTLLEDVVAQEFTKRTGMKVRNRFAILQHPKHPYMLANVDRMIVGKKEGLECKTASEYLKGEWEGDEVPTPYLLQIQHYMAVTGYDAWWIAVLLGGNKFIFKRIERDEEIIEYLIKLEGDFWANHVIKKNPPEFDGSEASTRLLQALYPQAEPKSEIQLDKTVETLIEARDAYIEDITALETKKKEIENQIKAQMGENEIGHVGSRTVKWSNVTSNRIDTKTLKAEKPEIYQQYTKPSVSRRFAIQ
ncbi:YqaJ viral recombinase family protein [Chryseomicrobium aureum]|uniref:YqaJ viral recombinase family nuclease n=1 Tax=Chryseomicrobium aureum TaxID=1441723 RepID=UPI00370DD12B